jgi:outer membrane receptor for ferrienterochelin and colicins
MTNKFRNFILLLLLVIPHSLIANWNIYGCIEDQERNKIIGAIIQIEELNLKTITNENGCFSFKNVQNGTYNMTVKFIGYFAQTHKIVVYNQHVNNIKYVLSQDVLNVGEVTISGSRRDVFKYKSPVIISTINNRIFEATQSLSISEGLSFTPGLRLENNCQNCGFTQLRMNGLDGAYSQILINSRPVFSALAGVYGLEMLPANMVERIEVVRGGGSVMYGGNAIAGTINIITKDPIKNTAEVGFNQSFINLESSDRTFNFNTSLVSDDLQKGITFYGFKRDRDPWDANGDSISEITLIRNKTVGFDAFYNTDKRGKFKVGMYSINEFRRGGNDFYLQPHQSGVTEQLQHQISNINLSFEQYSKNFKNKLSVYAAIQNVKRQSYYGAGGSIMDGSDTLSEKDVLALNAYGDSRDISMIGGIQFFSQLNEKLQLTIGAENNFNTLRDEMAGYSRLVEQSVNSIGTYAQLEWKPLNRLTLIAGGRLDYILINGDFSFGEYNLNLNQENLIPVPRLAVMYDINADLKLRLSYAQGYRVPQAFDEDLHIETVGGAARFIVLDQNLKTELSHSSSASLNYNKNIGSKQLNFVIEGFMTQLNNPFILSDPEELPNGVSIITKRNGDAALVNGFNLEGNVALSKSFIIQTGATIQQALYKTPEIIWEPEDDDEISATTITNVILKTPDFYGYATLLYKINKRLTGYYSGVYTGAMDVPYMTDPETEQTIIRTTPQFFEHNVKCSYLLFDKKDYFIQTTLGVQNLINSFQSDFDTGIERDAGYIYGPLRPRTVFFGLKFGLK